MNDFENINGVSAKGGSSAGGRKFIEGRVSSDKMDKTVVVAVNTMKTHPKYMKRYLMTRKYKAHDPENKFKVGDKVRIQETKPMSKGKKWEVIY